MEIFNFDKERNVTVLLAELLSNNGWDVVACHPPGGHTSFSLLDGRRSKGAYMPDVVALRYSDTIDDYLVIVAESKPSSTESVEDIAKLINLNESHIAWLAFRLQNHLDHDSWLNDVGSKIQKIVAFQEGDIQELSVPDNFITLKLDASHLLDRRVGELAPAKEFFSDQTFSDK
jgi:hypothetical protein